LGEVNEFFGVLRKVALCLLDRCRQGRVEGAVGDAAGCVDGEAPPRGRPVETRYFGRPILLRQSIR
jgi:hypothetical protein